MVPLHDESHPCDARRYLLERSQQLAGQRKLVEQGKSSGVTGESRNVCDKTVLDVAGGCYEYDRYRPGFVQHRCQGPAATDHDDVGLQAH